MKTQQEIKQFFKDHLDLFNPPRNITTGPNHSDIHKEMSKYHTFHWTWGKCFTIAQFFFYYTGGYEGPYILKCTRGIEYEVGGIKGNTSHWYCEHKVTKEIVDLTKEQFDGIYDIEEIYANSRRANFGWSHYRVNGKKVYPGCTAVSKQVLKFYEVFREQDKSECLEYHRALSKGLIEPTQKRS